MYIDHTTIRTNFIDETRDFLCEVFSLEAGERPATIIAQVEGYWLYKGDWPLIHIIKSNSSQQNDCADTAEAIDHVAFVLEDFDHFSQHLSQLGVPSRRSDVPELGIRRLFIKSPRGILIETIFKNND